MGSSENVFDPRLEMEFSYYIFLNNKFVKNLDFHSTSFFNSVTFQPLLMLVDLQHIYCHQLCSSIIMHRTPLFDRWPKAVIDSTEDTFMALLFSHKPWRPHLNFPSLLKVFLSFFNTKHRQYLKLWGHLSHH